MTTLAVRVSDSLLEQLDALVSNGPFQTRTEVVRTALEALIEEQRRREVDRAIVEGYRRHPPEPPDAFTDSLAQRSIVEEPW